MTIKALFSLALTALFLPWVLSSASEERKPNIVYLMTDDQRWDCFGCYGRESFRTENIDRLAEQGVVFDKAYHTVGICMPSRASVFTGRYFSNHNVGFTHPHNLTMSHEDYQQSYPAQLKQAGYRTGFIGKFGFAITDEAYHVFDQVKDYDLKEHLSPYFDFFAGQGVHFAGAFSTWPEDETLTNIYRRDRPRDERTLKTGDAMIHFLDTHPKDQPFCLSVSFYAVKNDNDKDMYPPHVKEFENATFDLPKNWVAGKNMKLPPVLDYWRGVKLHPAWTGTEEKYQAFVRRFAVQGYSVDLQVGRLVKKLEEMGELDHTVIIYTSDNGRFHGSHGLEDKAIPYDEAVKAPLIIFDGRLAKEQRGRRVDALVSSADYAPTMLSLAGVKVPEKMQGKSLVGLLQEKQDLSKWRDSVLLESLFLSALHGHRENPDIATINDRIVAENQSYRCRGVRTDRYKYFIYYQQTPVIEELYDMEEDPYEMNNLVADPDHAEVLADLRKRTEEFHREISQ